MWCTYPRCYQEAEARCVTCGQAFCTNHCAHWVYRSGDSIRECDLCQQHVTAEQVRAAHPRGLVASAVGIGLLLLAVAGGVAADVKARGDGLLALSVFAIAFLLFATCIQH